MKKIISFEKKIKFPTMIGEITAISLDQNLKFIDKSNIAGEFIVEGKYKLTEASRIEEDFKYSIPAEILLSESLDLETTKIDISDFYYEIESEENLICYIDVSVEGVEEIILQDEPKEISEIEEDLNEIEVVKSEPNKQEKEEEVLLRECDGDYVEECKQESEIIEEEIIEEESKEEKNIGSLFSSLTEKEESFATYSVIILRQEETINSIIDKYHTTKEELENYNDLSNLSIGSKIIIPLNND